MNNLQELADAFFVAANAAEPTTSYGFPRGVRPKGWYRCSEQTILAEKMASHTAGVLRAIGDVYAAQAKASAQPSSVAMSGATVVVHDKNGAL